MNPDRVVLALLALLIALSSTLHAEEKSDVIRCANLIYASTRSSVCFSDSFLLSVARDSTITPARKFRAVKLGSDEVYQYPFSIMTGEGAFQLTTKERENLKHYLEGGGFLLASAGCSSKEWDRCFRDEVKKVFPDKKLEDIPLSDEVFHTIYDIKKMKTHGGEAVLRGLKINGKIVLIYSSDELNDTSTMQGCCCCGGNEIANCRQINANIFAYALLQ